jgi:hypothetical protein
MSDEPATNPERERRDNQRLLVSDDWLLTRR